MKNFEDIARDRILEGTTRDIPENVNLDANDVAIFAAMVYALLRAGARREGPKGFQDAFTHFAQGGWAYSNDDELEAIRGALLLAVERFGNEARALRVYFQSLEEQGMSEEDATTLAIAALDTSSDPPRELE